MVLRDVAGVRTGESAEDLRRWLMDLAGGPTVHEAVVLSCPQHEDDPPTWTYVEADPRAGVARRRCLQCATVTPLLQSAQRWTHPDMWSCRGCAQSIAEVAVGLSIGDGDLVDWVVMGARCVECGRLDGLTDVVLPPTPLPEVLGQL